MTVVDPAQLDGVATALWPAADQIGAAVRAVHALPSLSAATPLGSALQEFQQVWRRLLQIVGESTNDSSAHLQAAARAWHRMDESVCRGAVG